jgi:hypothetical protein
MNKTVFDQARLAEEFGIIFMPGLDAKGPLDLKYMERRIAEDGVLGNLALDAQPQLVSAANAGILSLFTTYVDPRLIMVQVAPTKAAMLYGEQKYGDWVTDTAAFPVVERTGHTTAYGDFNQGGVAGYNVNWPQRQSFHYQLFTRWGERELARAAKARIDWANGVNMGAALAMRKFENLSYLFGVVGLQNFGGVNDPQLPAAIAATSDWFTETDPSVIYNDVLRLITFVVENSQGLLDAESGYRMGISPGNAMNFGKTNVTFATNVYDMLKKNFPSLKITTVPEFATAYAGGTELVQIIPDSVEGTPVVSSAFTEKMRAHAMITLDSSWRQKKSGGVWGTIYYQPAYVGQMHF